MKNAAIAISVREASPVPLWVLVGEGLARAYHFGWRAIVVPWLLVWPSFLVLAAALAKEGGVIGNVVTELQKPDRILLVLWIVAAALHTATYLSSRPYEGLIQKYREAQIARLGAHRRRERFFEDWRRV